MRFVSLVEPFQERRGWLFPVEFLSSVLVKSVDSVIIEDEFWGHEVFVEVTGLCVFPFSIV